MSLVLSPPVSPSIVPPAPTSRIRLINGIPLTDDPNAWREFCRPSPEPDEEPEDDDDQLPDDGRAIGLGHSELVALVIPRDTLAALEARACERNRSIDDVVATALRWYLKAGKAVAHV